MESSFSAKVGLLTLLWQRYNKKTAQRAAWFFSVLFNLNPMNQPMHQSHDVELYAKALLRKFNVSHHSEWGEPKKGGSLLVSMITDLYQSEPFIIEVLEHLKKDKGLDYLATIEWPLGLLEDAEPDPWIDLKEACLRENRPQVLYWLCDRLDAQLEYTQDDEPWLSFINSKEVMWELLKRDLPVQVKITHKNLLHYATSTFNDPIPLMEYLVQQGLEINRPCYNGQSLLHVAGYYEDLPVFNWLLQKGIDTQIRDDSGQTVKECLIRQSSPTSGIEQQMWDTLHERELIEAEIRVLDQQQIELSKEAFEQLKLLFSLHQEGRLQLDGKPLQWESLLDSASLKELKQGGESLPGGAQPSSPKTKKRSL